MAADTNPANGDSMTTTTSPRLSVDIADIRARQEQVLRSINLMDDEGIECLLDGLTSVLGEHEKQVREQIAYELETCGKKVSDEASYKVAAGDDGGFSRVLRGASITWTAKFVRGEVDA